VTNDDRTNIDEILAVWFGKGDVPSAEVRAQWWKKDPHFDALLRERFGALLDRGTRGELDGWANDAHGALALVILLDQFSRNIHRGTPRAFAADERALTTAKRAVQRGFDAVLPVYHRVFLYMPWMHSEDLDAQKECVRLFEKLAREVPPEVKPTVLGNVDFAKRHLEIVERFGRFPHRNVILGRSTTPEEEAFLLEPNSSF
jgi:uncharacterized protein (DUF924 family)